MGTVTVRLPDDTHKRIKELASSRKTSINKLYEEFTIMALTAFDVENRFKAMAGKCDVNSSPLLPGAWSAPAFLIPALS
jgi:hypothetical protein